MSSLRNLRALFLQHFTLDLSNQSMANKKVIIFVLYDNVVLDLLPLFIFPETLKGLV